MFGPYLGLLFHCKARVLLRCDLLSLACILGVLIERAPSGCRNSGLLMSSVSPARRDSWRPEPIPLTPRILHKWSKHRGYVSDDWMHHVCIEGAFIYAYNSGFIA